MLRFGHIPLLVLLAVFAIQSDLTMTVTMIGAMLLVEFAQFCADYEKENSSE